MRHIPDPGFSGDDGAVPDALAAALATYDTDPDAHHAATLAVLQHERLLVPVVAVLGDVEHERGLAHDKTSDMAAVLLRGRDGRTGLLAFTGSEPMRRWDPQARPVPVPAAVAARAALQDGASVMVVDVAGPVRLVVDHDDLSELAAGHLLVRVSGGYAWVRPVP